ncbi:MAG: hypothetical protein ACYDH9_11300 [Limisphaerales bacterium]
MKKTPGVSCSSAPSVPSALAVLVFFTTLVPAVATVLDDFNAAQRTGWTDANPAGLPLLGGQQTNGVFTFNLPALSVPMFVSSTKTSPAFELKEGRTIEFRVDMVNGQGPDSYAVLAFIPTSPGANSLAGYGLAKSESDVLVTKGINKYFIDDSPATPVKNTNVTLVLNLSVQNGNVNITAQVLDKDANNQVIWTRSFVDTPATDILGKGTDNPPAPYVTTGNFVLYLYANNGTDPNGYQVVYDNAEYFITDSTVMDDFNAAQRSGWTDSNPANLPLPGGQQANGVFTFNMPAINQSYFVGSTKTSKTFSLDEGTRHQFALDLVSGQGPDSYIVMAFVPTATGANSLAGYGFAKSESDILITKGINKYFIDDSPATPIKNTNVTMVLTLTVQNTNVTIQGQVLDKDNNNQVLWDRTFVDTPGTDILGTGTDSPPAPYVGMSGNVVLYLYANHGTDPNGYQVIVDNLIAAEPPGATNQPPIIANVSPNNGEAFLSAPVTIGFTASDDKALPDSGISVTINGARFTATNGLALSGDPTNRTVALTAGTGANTNYVASLTVTDSDGVSVTNTLYFDTFSSSNRIAEIEDYNFSNGQYYNNPVPASETGGQLANSYFDQAGTEGVDFHDTRTSPNGTDTPYRTQDPVRMQHSLDQPRPQYDASSSIYGYDVGDIAADEWLNYTKDFAAGNYEVYLRESIVGFPEADSTLELVTSDPTQTNQTVNAVGSFLGKLSGFTFLNVPLTDGSGLNKVVLRLSGKTTLRLHQITGDTASSARYQNYLIFVPVGAASVQRPVITSLEPQSGATVQTVAPAVVVSIQNRDTTLDTNSVVLQVNGQTVSPTVQATSTGATVTWAMTPLPASGALNSASIAFKDNQGTNQTTAWNFTVTYLSLNAANARTTPGSDRGMQVRVVQAPQGSALDNSLDRAELQLAPNSTIPVAVDTNVVLQIMSMTKNGAPFGGFPDYTDIPGVDGSIGYDDFVVEAETWLSLSAGVYEFGVLSDDGYKMSAGTTPASKDPVLAFHNGGPANETTDFVVPASGVYPFRFLWYQRGGDAYNQWFSVNRTTGERTLINDPNSTNAVKAYLSASTSAPPQFAAPSLRNGQVTITWTGGGTLQESTDLRNWTPVQGNPAGTYPVLVGTAAGAKFYRVTR